MAYFRMRNEFCCCVGTVSSLLRSPLVYWLALLRLLLFLTRGKRASHHWLLARSRWLVPFWTFLFWPVPFWLIPIGSFPSVVVRWVRWLVLWVVMAVKSMALMMAAGRMMSEGVGE
jgi:hypothetical protein